jgi:cytochrome b561
MHLANSKTRYGAGPQVLHWLTAIFVVCGWLLGQFGDYLPRGNPRAVGLFIHMTLGQCIIALIVTRLAWRIVNPPPPFERTRFGRMQQAAATLGHYVLYALLVAVPIAGIVVQLSRGHALPIFGLWTIASPWHADRAFSRSVLKVHEYLADAVLILAFLHAAVALMHHWVLGDATLMRMLPGSGARLPARGGETTLNL